MNTTNILNTTQQALFDGIVTHSSCMVFLLDPAGHFQYISPNFQRISQHDITRLLGQSFVPLVHPEDVSHCQAAIVNLITTEQPQSKIEYRARYRDGSFHWHCANLVLLPGQDNQPLVLGLCTVIDDRHRAEASLKESQLQIERMNANVPGMIYRYEITASGEARFTYVNDFCRRYFGITPEDWISGKVSPHAYIAPEDLAAFEQSVIESMQTLQPWQHEWRNFSPITGEVQWFRGQSIPAKQANGSIVWDGIMIDITEQKLAALALQESKQAIERAMQELQQTQTQLVQSEKMSSLGQLVAGVAHEINNPMNFIAGNIEHASLYVDQILALLNRYQQQYPNPPETIQTYTEQIDLDFLLLDLPKLINSMQVGSQRVRDIVLNLRNFSRMDEAEIKDANLHDGIDSTLMILKHRLQRSHGKPAIQINTAYGDIPSITCHAGQLNQVFMNLIANAIDALDERDEQRSLAAIQAEPSSITITSQYDRPRACIQIRIADNGIGIPAQIQSQLFDPFFTTKPVGQGTGMGLAISYQVITEKHKGKLSCHSRLGAGTEFLIELPLHPEDAAASFQSE